MILLTEATDTPFVMRVEAELRMLGYAVETVKAVIGEKPHEGLSDTARDTGADVVAKIAWNAGVADVWVADDVGDRLEIARVDGTGAGEDADAEVAVGVAELIRAVLIEVEEAKEEAGKTAYSQVPAPANDAGTVEPKPEPEPEPEPEEEAAVGPAPRRDAVIHLEAMPALNVAGRGVKPMMGLHMGLRFRLGRNIGVGASGMIPLFPSRDSNPQGKTEVDLGAIGGTIMFLFPVLDGRLVPDVGVGFSAVFMKVEGRPDVAGAGVGHEEIVTTGAPFARGGLALELTDLLRLRLDVQLGFALVRAVVQVGDDRTSYGRPLFSGMLGIDLAVW